MRRVLVCCAIAVATTRGLGATLAHPGGTDRYGCHVESANGIRHCHNDGEATEEKLNAIPTAEVGLEVGGRTYLSERQDVTYFGSWRVQHDGSMLFLGGLGTSGRLGLTNIGAFVEIEIGAAWVAREQLFFALRAAAGLRFPLMRLGTGQRRLYLKVGFFLEGIADEINAEPAGICASISLAL